MSVSPRCPSALLTRPIGLSGVKGRRCWDAFMSAPLEGAQFPRRLDRCRWRPLLWTGVGRGRFLPPSSVPSESSPHFLSRKRGGSYLKRCLFGNSPFIIVMAPKFGSVLLLVYKSEQTEMLEEQLIIPKDLDVIWEGYGIPVNIILSAPTLHETSLDHRPEHLCLNEYMLRVGVQIPFEFRVAEAL
ncbi:hypothetical protein ACLOJK_013738 [Asimina triloba]